MIYKQKKIVLFTKKITKTNTARLKKKIVEKQVFKKYIFENVFFIVMFGEKNTCVCVCVYMFVMFVI